MLTGSHLAHDFRPCEPVTELTRRYCKPGRPASTAELRGATDVAPFAMAAYGALFYVYVNPQPSALARFCYRALCTCCGSGRGSATERHAAAAPAAAEASSTALGFPLDPTRVVTRAAVSAIANVPVADVKHISSTNAFNLQAPYFIALHRHTRSVVVSVRGTFRCAPILCTRIPSTAHHYHWPRIAGMCLPFRRHATLDDTRPVNLSACKPATRITPSARL